MRSIALSAVSAIYINDPNGIRTRVAALKGPCPRPLDDGAGNPSHSGTSTSRSVRLRHALSFRAVLREESRLARTSSTRDSSASTPQNDRCAAIIFGAAVGGTICIRCSRRQCDQVWRKKAHGGHPWASLSMKRKKVKAHLRRRRSAAPAAIESRPSEAGSGTLTIGSPSDDRAVARSADGPSGGVITPCCQLVARFPRSFTSIVPL